MSIRAKILTAFLLLSLAAVAASGVSLLLLGDGRGALLAESERIDGYSGQVQRANEIVDAIYERIFATMLIASTHPYSLASLDDDSVEFYRTLDAMDRLIPERRSQHAAFREAYISFYIFAKRMLEQNDFRTLSGNPGVLEDFQLRQRLLSGELARTLAGMREEGRENLAKMGEIADSMNHLSIAVAAATVLAAALAAWLLSRSFARPMTRLLQWVESTEGAGGGGQVEPHHFGSDEVGRLALAFAELRKRLEFKERELMRRNLESVGRLAGGVAHEYNNLLNAISACLYPLRSERMEEGKVREEAERISLLCRRGGDLSSQLLEVAGKRAGKTEWVEPSYFSAQLESLLPRLVTDGIKITVEAEKNLPSVKCSPALLLSALLNLVYNSVDALEGGGSLKVSVFGEEERGGGSSVVFSVADSGKGINPEAMPHIFDPFFTTKEPGRGTGLGLSIVHSFAEHHGGTVSVSTGKGGTEFRLRIPVALSDGVQGGAQRRRAAVLTERPDAGDLVAQALLAAGIEPLLPNAGEDLLDALQRYSPSLSLVLIDTELAGVAPELAHKLIRRFFPGVPVTFFGPNRLLAAAIDPQARWVESPSPENVAAPAGAESRLRTH